MSAASSQNPQAGAPESGPRIVSTNPATGERLGDVPDVAPDGVRAAVDRARAAQAAWGALPVRERAARMLGFRDQVVRRAADLVELLVAECGKPRNEALGLEVMPLADLATYYCKRAERLLAPHDIPLHLMIHRRSYVHYAPRGVVGIVSPWNFPLTIPLGEAVMCWLAGNAVVLKPSEITPLIALLAKELFDASGLPPDLFQVVTGRGATGAALVDSGVDMVLFTGSVATGKRVSAACGERLIPCVLELGGKAPAVVCADADLERTANALVFGAFANSGQVCVSVERVYAHELVHDELVEMVVAKARKLRQGDPRRGEVDVGSMTWDRQLEHVVGLVETSVAQGAKIALGGRRGPGGLFHEPTVLTGCTQDMDVMRKEIFGPLLPIMKVGTEDEAIRLANDSHLGLAAYVFSSDRKKAERLAERISAGTVMINDVLQTYGAPETPFGGLKQSGVGITHSDDGLRHLCELRHVNIERFGPLKRELWWYPYSDKVYRRTLKLLGWLFRGGL